MTALTTIIVATPSITLTTLARAMYRVRRYRQQSRYLYMGGRTSLGPEIGRPGASVRPRPRAGPVGGPPARRRPLRAGAGRPHQREEDHVADARPVQQQHAEPVDPD